MKKLSVKLSAKRISKSENGVAASQAKNFALWANEYTIFSQAKKLKELKGELVVQTQLSTKTIENRFSGFKKALVLGVDLSTLTSFASLEKALKELKAGTKELVNGKTVDNPTKTAEIQQEKEIIKASNDNEIVNMLANEEFKKIMFIIEKQGFELSILQKAIKVASVKV